MTPAILFSFSVSLLPDIGQEIGHDAQKREKSRQMENILDAKQVGEPAEDGGAYATQPEGESEESPRNHTHIARQEFCGIDQDGRHGRRHHHSHDNGQHNGPCHIAVRQQ